MQTVMIKLPFQAINAPENTPIVIYEPLDFAGSLMLLDPGHSWNSSTSGTTLSNLLAYRAVDVVPSSTIATVGGESIILSTEGGGANRLSERTNKGAIHLFYKGSSADFYNEIAKYNFPAAILNHIKTSGHEFYIALSHRITLNPQGIGTNATRNQWSGITQNDADAIYSFDTQSDKPVTTGRTFYARSGTATDETLGLVHRRIGTNISIPTETNGANPMFGVGRNSNWTIANAKPTGSILYTFYVCDLTVAGKTAAEVDARFQARQAALFASGGRYADDSWTDPSII